MKHLYSYYFPTPKYLAMDSCAFDISDQTIKYGKLRATSSGLRLVKHGQVNIPIGVVTSGKIEDPAKLSSFLKKISDDLGVRYARVSLPEEQMYLFTLSITKVDINQDLRETILYQIEEHIPLKALDTIFDYEIIKQTPDTTIVLVVAMAISTIESYIEVFKSANLTPISFELEAQAIARSVVSNDDKSSALVVDFGETRTGVSIVSDGKVLFTTTLDIGGNILTNMIAKNFSLSFEDAEKLKNNYGTDGGKTVDEVFPVILNGVSVLRDELNKHYQYWMTHNDDGTDHEKNPIKKIILCGGGANLPGVSSYLEASMKIKVENANVWTNILDLNEFIPEISYKDSLDYATVLGLALSDYSYDFKSPINILPDGSKKILNQYYWLRFSSLIMMFLSASSILLFILMYPAYRFSKIREDIANKDLKSFNDMTEKNIKSDFESISTDINSKLAILSAGGPYFDIQNKVFGEFIPTIPSGIKVSQINYSEKPDGVKTLDIEGQAVSRSVLSSFRQSLSRNPIFSNVDLPSSNYLEKSNLPFSISMTIK